MIVEPFNAIRYDDPQAVDDGVVDVSDVVCIRADLDERPTDDQPFDVRLLLSDKVLWSALSESKVLAPDPDPALYLYRLGYTRPDGASAQCSAVIGRLGPATSEVAAVPTPTAPMPSGFTELLVPSGLPLCRATDRLGNHHRIWPITQAGYVNTIASLIQPLVPSEAEAGMVIASESDFQTPVTDQHTLGDLIAVGLLFSTAQTISPEG